MFDTAKKIRQLTKDIQEGEEKIRQNKQIMIDCIMKIMIWNGVEKGYKTLGEFVENIESLLEGKNLKLVYADIDKKNEYEAERFVKDAFFYVARVPNFMNAGIHIPTVTYIYGDDGFLKYSYQCDKCKSIITVDHSDASCENPIACQYCLPGTKSPHNIIEVDTPEWVVMQPWVTHNLRLNTDKVYRKKMDDKMERDRFIYSVTSIFRPSWWRVKLGMKRKPLKVKPNTTAKDLLVG